MTLSGEPGLGGRGRCSDDASPLRSEKLDLRLTPGAKQTLQRAVAQRSVTDVVLDLEGMARRC